MLNTNIILSNTVMETITSATSAAKDLFAFFGPLGNILLVLLILWIGKFVVKSVGKLARKALSKTSIDDKIAAKLGHDVNVTKGLVGFIQAILMLFILIFALGMAGLDSVSEPLKALLSDVFRFIPKLLLAGVMGYIVYMIANLIKQLLGDVLNAAKVDERLGAKSGETPIAGALSTAAFAFFLLLFAPAVLNILGIDAVSEPIQGIVTKITSAVPNVILAIVLITIGCFIGSLAKRLITGLLEAANVDAYPAKLGVSMGSRSLSGIIGTLVMVSVVILTVTAAIESLNVAILSEASQGLFSGYFNILLAVGILIAGLIGARITHDHLVGTNAGVAKAAKVGIIVLTTVVALNRTGLATGLTDLPYTVAIYAAGVAIGIGGAIAIGFGAQGFFTRWFDKRG